MSAPASSARRMTVDEFQDWNPPCDNRWELVDGRPVMMAPPAAAHTIIVANLAGEIRTALRDRPNCTVRAGTGVRRREDEHTLRIPDLAVSCHPHRVGEKLTEDPLILVEILSPSMKGEDQRVKLPEYHAQPSATEIVLVSTAAAFVEVHRRIEGDRWLSELAFGRDAAFRLPSIEATILLSEVYRGVQLPGEGDQTVEAGAGP